MSDQNDQSFLDKKSLIAIGLAVAFWVFWSAHLSVKYPEKSKETSQVQKPSEQDQKAAAEDKDLNSEFVALSPAVKAKKSFKNKVFSFSNKLFSLKINSEGMGLSQITLKNYTTLEDKPLRLAESKKGFFFTQVNADPYFKLSQKSPLIYEGTITAQGYKVKKEYIFYENESFVDVVFKVYGKEDSLVQIESLMEEKQQEEATGGFLTNFIPRVSPQEIFVNSSEGSFREPLVSLETKDFEQPSMIALSKSYFTIALQDNSNIFPSLRVSKEEDSFLAKTTYNLRERKEEKELKQRIYIGAKSFSKLKAVGPAFVEIQDFGFFGFIGKYFLNLLKFFYDLSGNWGLAIIFLTLVVRLVFLPLNLKSMKSMQSMQKIQPLIKEAKEKHKDDSAKANQAVMEIMKNNKTNPFGGCMFMLAQLPIFFALYQILAKSIYFYKAPFALWITDLSSPDPYYILPALMVVTMVLQSRISAKTMPKEQARVMTIVAFVFGLFMISLPSGLCLYIFISTLFGFIQQVIVNKSLRKE